MQKKLEELRKAIEDSIVEEDGYVEKLDKIAHDIANLALDYFSGSKLEKAMAIAIAVAEFVNELE